MILSKSDFFLFRKHPAWLWIQKFEPARLADLKETSNNRFSEDGYVFEQYAERLFPDGIRIGFDTNEGYPALVYKTNEAINKGIPYIFQAGFEFGNLRCKTDIIHNIGNNVLDIYEIKASTDTKSDHEIDLAFQRILLESCGYHVRDTLLILVNGDYVRHGPVDPHQLAFKKNITNEVLKRVPEVRQEITEAQSMLKLKNRPPLSPSLAGDLSQWLKVYRHLILLEIGSIYDLSGIKGDCIGKLERRNIRMIRDITDDISLSDKQRLQVKSAKAGKPLIDTYNISTYLSNIMYPLYFLDYETLSDVIPPYDGTTPYQQIPFQYSLHIVDKPGSGIRHVGYIHAENSNPIRPLSQSLRANIGESGTVFVWYDAFEKGRNTEMGQTDETYAKFYDMLNSRIVDLMTPFKQGWYVDEGFRGSVSLKKVLPVLVPDLTYSTLNIQGGGDAQRLWMETVLEGKHDDEKESIFSDLEQYCSLDTLALVRIYEVLDRLTNK